MPRIARLSAAAVALVAWASPTLSYAGTAPVSTTGVDTEKLAAKGATIAAADPLFAELRKSQPDKAALHGFDVGAGVSDGRSEWGPDMQKILDSLQPVEQEGYRGATSYALDRNRNTERARLGAKIAATDPEVASGRRQEADARYTLGYDIATAIFGDHAKGAQGDTAVGPASLEIRDALSDPARRGFDDSVYLHLGSGRHY